MRLENLVLVMSLTAGTSWAVQDDVGKQAFIDGSCGRCHSIESEDIHASVKSESMKGPDLGELDPPRDASWISAYLKRDVKLHDKAHRSPWRGTDEELKAIADWLAARE